MSIESRDGPGNNPESKSSGNSNEDQKDSKEQKSSKEKSQQSSNKRASFFEKKNNLVDQSKTDQESPAKQSFGEQLFGGDQKTADSEKTNSSHDTDSAPESVTEQDDTQESVEDMPLTESEVHESVSMLLDEREREIQREVSDSEEDSIDEYEAIVDALFLESLREHADSEADFTEEVIDAAYYETLEDLDIEDADVELLPLYDNELEDQASPDLDQLSSEHDEMVTVPEADEVVAEDLDNTTEADADPENAVGHEPEGTTEEGAFATEDIVDFDDDDPTLVGAASSATTVPPSNTSTTPFPATHGPASGTASRYPGAPSTPPAPPTRPIYPTPTRSGYGPPAPPVSPTGVLNVPPPPTVVHRTEYIDRYHRRNRGRDLLVGALVGYVIGRRGGRKRTEKRLKPEITKLETEVKQLHDVVSEKEERIRLVARKAAEHKQSIAGEKLPTKEAVVRRQQRVEVKKTLKKREEIIEKASKTKLGMLRVESAKVFRERRIIDGSENSPKRKPVEIMTVSELLERVEPINVGDITVVQAYEQGRLPLPALREITKRYMRSQNYSEVFYKELLPDPKQLSQSRDKIAKLQNGEELALGQTDVDSKDSASKTSDRVEETSETNKENKTTQNETVASEKETSAEYDTSRIAPVVSAAKIISNDSSVFSGQDSRKAGDEGNVGSASLKEPSNGNLPWEDKNESNKSGLLSKLPPAWIMVIVVFSVLATLLLLNTH